MRLVVLCAVLGVAIAAPASAKSLAKAEACGLDGCVSFLNASEIAAVVASSGDVVAAPPVGPYYVVNYEHRAQVGTVNAYIFLYEPKSGLFATNGSEPGQLLWFRVEPTMRSALQREVAHFRPFPLGRASWPNEIKSPGRLPMPDAARRPMPNAARRPMPVAAAGTQDRTPDVIVALALALAGCGFLAARRLRIRKMKTA